MLIHPQFDPVAIHLGPLAIRWYGLMYLAGFIAFLILGRRRAASQPWHGIDGKQLDDLLFYGVLGVIIGGRLGQVLFYEPGYYLAHPLEIAAVWKGGMSFHGGFLGVLVAMWLWGRWHGRTFFQVTDFIAPLVPLGLMAGRIGNFINGELWGRIAAPDFPLAMIFPQVDSLPRHPSPLYQAAGEGLLLLLVLIALPYPRYGIGTRAAWACIAYGSIRIVMELFKAAEPEPGIIATGIRNGQAYSLVLIAVGAAIAWKRWKR